MSVNINVIRQSNALRKAFGLFGGFRLRLDETVAPVAIVEDLVGDNWKDAFFAEQRGLAGAGNVNAWQLSNPAASGQLVNLYEVALSSGTSQIYAATVTNTPVALATILSPQWQDLDGTYLVPTTFPTAQVIHGTPVLGLVGAAVFTARALANTVLRFRPHVLLHPGQRITLFQGTANLDGTVGFQWRERPLLPSER